MKTTKIEVGDMVVYTTNFVRSVGLNPSNDHLVHRRLGGVVVAMADIGPIKLAVVMTGCSENPRRVNVNNLERVATASEAAQRAARDMYDRALAATGALR